MAKKIQLKIINILLIIALTILPIMLSAYFYVFNGSNYNSLFDKHNVSEKYPEIDLVEYNNNVLDYLLDKSKILPGIIYLDENEIEHMSDVKGVFSFFFILFRITLIIIFACIALLLYLKKSKLRINLSRALVYSGSVSLASHIITSILFYFFFDISFNLFHGLFFEKGTWLFPVGSNLVTIYPETMFFDIFTRVFIITLLFSTIFIISGLSLRKKFIKTNS